MRHPFLTAWLVALGASLAAAQPQPRKEPAYYAGNERTPRAGVSPPGIRLGLPSVRSLALAPLSKSELAALGVPGARLRTGVHRILPDDALSHGAWEVTSEGTPVWRMAMQSPGSVALRVEFRNFSVGDGQVWLHDGTHFAGPYTGQGTFGDGNFWSASLFSDSITIEYQPGSGFAAEGPPPFEIRRLSHQARTAARDAAEAPAADPADYCHLDPNCYPDWKTAMSMVGQLAFEENGVKYLCSGSLVATRDNSFKPYLLTAGHCIHSEAAARTLEVYWTYQKDSCGGTAPASRDTGLKSTVGGHLIDFGTLEEGDYSLVLLQDVPKGVTFSGWDAGDPPIGSGLAGIHHPKGSWKRISFGERIGDAKAEVEDFAAPAGKYLQVLWDKGRTEPGSSGSPLFSSPGVIVGTLTYGPVSPVLTSCQISPSIDGYGRFSNTYNHLKVYLENLPAATVMPDKTALRFSATNRVSPEAQIVKLTTLSTGQVAYKLRADAPWIRLSSNTGTLSANAPAPIGITIDSSQFDRPDQYDSTVTILSGTAAPQFVNVTVIVTSEQSDVVASISPNPVSSSGGLWNFTIRLDETRGAATRVTGLKFNAIDYSASIRSWFGTDRLPAKGSLEAPLQGTGFPTGTQYFEFEGVDEATGRHWYRVATVTFQ